MADSKENLPLITNQGTAGAKEDSSQEDQLHKGATQSDSKGPKDDLNSNVTSGNSENGGNGTDPNGGPSRDEDGYQDVLSELHESEISSAGYGKMQILIYTVLAFGLLGDGVEVFVMGFILAGAEKDLCMTAPMKGWLGSMAFVGMMVGALIWGNLADTVGRRTTLIVALSVNVIFGIFAAFVPYYWMFLICRFGSGVGIGGSIPVALTYVSELCPKDVRGGVLSWIHIAWPIGSAFTALVAFLVIPNKELSFMLPGGMMFHSWRVFLLLVLIPTMLGVAGLFFMPETPRYLLEVGRYEEAMALYSKIRRINKGDNTQTDSKKHDLPKQLQIQQPPNSESPQSSVQSAGGNLGNYFRAVRSLFSSPLTKNTLILIVCWMSICFGFHGLTIWFPELLKKAQQKEYFSHEITVVNQTFYNSNVTGILENVYYQNCIFKQMNYVNLEMKHVTFHDVLIQDSVFRNVDAKKTSFHESIIKDTSFDFTNFYPDRFVSTEIDNVNFTNIMAGCRVDFDINYNSRNVYLEQFIGQIPNIVANIIGALVMDRIGRKIILVGGLFTSAVSVFFIWFAFEEAAVVAMNGVFYFFTRGVWLSLACFSVELYPTHLRGTGSGILSAFGRLAVILGSITFGELINLHRAAPILITATVLAIGGVVALFLPETKRTLLH